MTKRSVKKVVIVHFLEAAKLALTHLSEWRMELSNRGDPCPPELTGTYADVRRIRDYLQKCMSLPGEVADWQMSEADENNLVSCAVHVLREIDADMATDGSDLRYQQKTWLREKQKILVDWSVELATQRVKDLPAPATGTLQAVAVQELHAKVVRKLGGPTEGMTLVKAFGPTPTSKSLGVPSVTDLFGASNFTEKKPRTTRIGKKSKKTTESPTGKRAKKSKKSKTPKTPKTTRTTKATKATKAPKKTTGKATTPSLDESIVMADPSEETLLDARTVQDPRLRAFLALDLAAFRRALDARDHRLAIVHVSSILEAVVMDYILLHREELGASGTPDGWNLQEFLLKRMGNSLSSKDRNSLYHLFSASELLRPINQFMAPTIVTPSTMEQHLAFVKKVLVELGYRGSRLAEDIAVLPPEFTGSLSPKEPGR